MENLPITHLFLSRPSRLDLFVLIVCFFLSILLYPLRQTYLNALLLHPNLSIPCLKQHIVLLEVDYSNESSLYFSHNSFVLLYRLPCYLIVLQQSCFYMLLYRDSAHILLPSFGNPLAYQLASLISLAQVIVVPRPTD